VLTPGVGVGAGVGVGVVDGLVTVRVAIDEVVEPSALVNTARY